MNNSLKNNPEYKIKQTFITANDNFKPDNKSFETSKIEKQKENRLTIKSATSRKWSIKFKK